jgi:hypothetical protein
LIFSIFFAVLYNAENCPILKIYSVPCDSALDKFYCIFLRGCDALLFAPKEEERRKRYFGNTVLKMLRTKAEVQGGRGICPTSRLVILNSSPLIPAKWSDSGEGGRLGIGSAMVPYTSACYKGDSWETKLETVLNLKLVIRLKWLRA